MKQIHVTNENIKNGRECSGTYCPVSQALKTTLRKMGIRPKAVFTDSQMIRYSDSAQGKRFIFFTPRKAQAALVKFDAGKPIAPFAFSLGNPVQEIEIRKYLGKRRASYKKAKIKLAGKGRTRRHIKVNGRPPPVNALLTSTERRWGMRVLERAFAK